MERKKLLLIISIVFTVFIVGVIVLVSVLSPGKGEPEPAPSPTQTITEENPENAGIDPNRDYDEEGAPIVVDEAEEDAPPSDIYANNYDNDLGYAPLPEGFEPTAENIYNTVYEEPWALEKMYTLFCELSTKNTGTERALMPLEDFSKDLASVKYENAGNMRSTVNNILSDYRNYDGKRIPGDLKNKASTLCELTKFSFEEGEIEGEHNHG